MRKLVAAALGAALIACAPPAQEKAKEAPAPAAPPTVAAPAGGYAIDHDHSSLVVHVPHLGLSSYVLRFTKIDATLTLNPTNVAQSSVQATIDPMSVRADLSSPYHTAQQGPRYRSWDEQLGASPDFLNGRQFQEITFRSTKVEPTGENTARVTGDLTFLGQTHPVVLETTLTGSYNEHPFTRHGALGFRATGTFKRSQFGMTSLIAQGIVGDDVTVEFNGEFAENVSPPDAAK